MFGEVQTQNISNGPYDAPNSRVRPAPSPTACYSLSGLLSPLVVMVGGLKDRFVALLRLPPVSPAFLGANPFALLPNLLPNEAIGTNNGVTI